MKKTFRLTIAPLCLTATASALTGCARDPYPNITPQQAKAVAREMRPAFPPQGKLPPGQRGKPIIITVPPPK